MTKNVERSFTVCICVYTKIKVMNICERLTYLKRVPFVVGCAKL